VILARNRYLIAWWAAVLYGIAVVAWR